MFTTWIRPIFYLLVILAVSCLAGMYYWEYLYRTATTEGRNELREGWSYIVIYSWPIFATLALLIAWKWRQLTKVELGYGSAVIVALVVFFSWVTWS